jgi:hypothetical protein
MGITVPHNTQQSVRVRMSRNISVSKVVNYLLKGRNISFHRRVQAGSMIRASTKASG